MEALEKGRTIVVDELDNSLHLSLARYFIGLFHDAEVNRNGAQLIFHSHDDSLLGLELFRRDQIYFVEKDYHTGVTDLYSLTDFLPENPRIFKKDIYGEGMEPLFHPKTKEAIKNCERLDEYHAESSEDVEKANPGIYTVGYV